MGVDETGHECSGLNMDRVWIVRMCGQHLAASARSYRHNAPMTHFDGDIVEGRLIGAEDRACCNDGKSFVLGAGVGKRR